MIHRRLRIVALVTTLFLLATASAVAAPASNKMTPEVIELARHPESDVTLPSIQVTKHQDGRVTVHGSGRHKIDNRGVHYRIQINLEDNTYKAVDVPALSGTTNLEPTTTRLQGDISLLATSSIMPKFSW